MAKVTVTTNDGEVVLVLTDGELPVFLSSVSSSMLANDVFDAVKLAREKE